MYIRQIRPQSYNYIHVGWFAPARQLPQKAFPSFACAGLQPLVDSSVARTKYSAHIVHYMYFHIGHGYIHVYIIKIPTVSLARNYLTFTWSSLDRMVLMFIWTNKMWKHAFTDNKSKHVSTYASYKNKLCACRGYCFPKNMHFQCEKNTLYP